MELPKGWVWTSLGEVTNDPQYGWTTRASSMGTLHLLRTTDITSGLIDWSSVPFCEKEPENVKKYLLEDGDIVISRAGSVGYSYLVNSPKRSIFASYLIRFKPLINRNFLAYFLKSPIYWEAISEKSIGIAMANVNASKLKQIEVPLPPLAEQQRIVNKIEELFTNLDKGVESLNQAKSKLKIYRQAILKYAMEGKLTEKWREENKEKVEPASVLLEKIKKENNIMKSYFNEDFHKSELPKNWSELRVKDIGEIVTGTTPSKSINEYYGHDCSFFKPKDLNKGYYVKTSEDGLSFKGMEKARILPIKSILVTCIGATIGKTGFTRVEGASNQQINAIIPFENVIPEFIYFYSISPQFQKNIIVNSSSTTLPILNKSKFEILKLFIPPLEEQQEIVTRIEKLFSLADYIEETANSKLEESKVLRQSILKKAFEGKLVPQDPNDEPAEVLLEKIKMEKSNKGKTIQEKLVQ